MPFTPPDCSYRPLQRLSVTAFLLTIVFFAQALPPANGPVPVALHCNFWQNPAGIDTPHPVLSWTIQADSTRRGVTQTAYQILVAPSADELKKAAGSVWNSGRVASDRMGQIHYGGRALQSSRTYWWCVRIWDEKDSVSVWSAPARWTTGLLMDTDWQADWISATGAEKYAPAYRSARLDFNLKRDLPEMRAKQPKSTDPNFSSMLLRKAFVAPKKIQRAVVHVCGLGHYELSINGHKVGDHLLSPGWTNYRKTVLYDTYDVTDLVRAGRNAIGLILSNGMYNIQPDSVRYVKFLNTYGPLKAIVHLRLDYTDGTTEIIRSDTTWLVSPGPVTYSNLFGGEDFDARLSPAGWNKPAFKPTGRWTNALVCASPGGSLKGLSGAAPPIKAIDTLAPVRINRLSPTIRVYDLGQNASIIPAIRVKGAPGSRVRITPAELVKPDGSVDRASATQDGIRPAWWQYTIASSTAESWFPQFFYQGARYLQVELFPADGSTALPVVEELAGIVVHTSATPVGNFACSNNLFNQIYTLIRWAQRSNLMSIITDCPHREKMGWLEQYHLNGPSLRYNFDLLTLFGKGMNDMADSQLGDGFVPNIAPEFFHAGSAIKNNGFRNSPEWGSSFIIVPWQQYLFSGDTTLISRYYDAMNRYITFLDTQANGNILNFGLGDWYDIGPKAPWGSQLTPVAFTATAIYQYDNQLMANMAALLGKTDDAQRFGQKAQAIKESFNKTFYNAEKGIYATGSNTTAAMPLALNIVEPAHRKKLIDTLVADIRNRGNSFTSGDVGYRFLLTALAMEGRSDVIFDMNNQSNKPGYGYQLKQGATSLTEKWDANVGDFGSQNHFMLGQINEWFFHDLLGIGVDSTGPGFRKAIIRPTVVGDLTWAKGSYQTVSGLITTEWHTEAGAFTLDVSIPANTSAMVYVPAATEADVTESNKPASRANGVTFIRLENGKAVFEVASGHFHFVAPR